MSDARRQLANVAPKDGEGFSSFRLVSVAIKEGKSFLACLGFELVSKMVDDLGREVGFTSTSYSGALLSATFHEYDKHEQKFYLREPCSHKMTDEGALSHCRKRLCCSSHSQVPSVLASLTVLWCAPYRMREIHSKNFS